MVDDNVVMSEQIAAANNAPTNNKGIRGEIGVATPSLIVKNLWRQTYAKVDKKGKNKKVWVFVKNAPTLKKFARLLVVKGDAVAKEWFDNKSGAKDTPRSDANIKAAVEASMKSKAAKKGK